VTLTTDLYTNLKFAPQFNFLKRCFHKIRSSYTSLLFDKIGLHGMDDMA